MVRFVNSSRGSYEETGRCDEYSFFKVTGSIANADCQEAGYSSPNRTEVSGSGRGLDRIGSGVFGGVGL